MTALTTRLRPQHPAPCEPRLRRTIHWLVSGAHLSGGRINLLPDRVLDADTRDALDTRLIELDRGLASRQEEVADVVEALLKYFRGFTSMRDGVHDAAERIGAYCDTLSDLPAWAVVETLKALRGQTDGKLHEFAASEGTIHSLAFQRCQPWIRERQEIRTILSATAAATPAAKDERGKVDAMIGDLAASLRMDAATTSLAEQRAEVERREREQQEVSERAARLADGARARGGGTAVETPDAVALAVATALSRGLRGEDGSPPSLEVIAAAVAAELRDAGFVAVEVKGSSRNEGGAG